MKRTTNLILSVAIAALVIPCFALAYLPIVHQDVEGEVGAETCLGCHDDMGEKMALTIHGRLGAHEMDQARSCELCHGPGEAHASSSGEEPMPHPFNADTRDNDANASCVTCHVGGETMGWHSSEHANSGVTCVECHSVKEPFQKRDAVAQAKLCTTCHSDQTALFNLPSHHPLREGKMACNECHNPHGGEEMMLRADNVNDLCLSCHADKHGPFLYEHEPVMENCLICHTAKGSVNNNLLQASEPALCLRCHAGHEDVHPNLGSTTARRAGYLNKCSRCHSQIHGSDLPGFTGPSRFIR